MVISIIAVMNTQHLLQVFRDIALCQNQNQLERTFLIGKIYTRVKEKNVNFITDDIVNTKLKSNEFDYIFDRGCFHVLSPRDRKEYINKITRILKDNGILFLKCFSDKEPMGEGSYKFSQDEIKDLFSESFIIDSIKETAYQGTLNPFPKAPVVMIKSG